MRPTKEPSLYLSFVIFSLLAVPVWSQPLPTLSQGKFEVSLRLPPDGLFAQEEMEMEARVVDTSQVDPVLGPTPVVGARLRGVIDMPSMAGMPKVQEELHPEGVAGEYGLHPTFAHGGVYRLLLTVEPIDADPFTVEFSLSVKDASEAKNRKPGVKPFQLDVRSSPKNPRAGEPVDFQISVRRQLTKELVTSFEQVHERLMHLLIIRSDLGQFSHEHPEIDKDGTFRIRYTFAAGGEYHFFADFAPKGAGSHVLLAKVKVTGKTAARFDLSSAAPADQSLSQRAGDLQVSLKLPGDEIPVRKTITVEAQLKSEQGAPVTDLEPYLGALGHFILVHQDGVTMVHSHPDERQPNSGKDGTVSFLSRFPKAGLYRGWAQFQRSGKILTVPFILRAKDGEA
jgi:hypothetical protein